METAHSIGMESTATMVLGLGETIEERIEHMRRVRDLQDKNRWLQSFHHVDFPTWKYSIRWQ